MKNDDLEFSISQYIDNALAPAERAALEIRLAEDADARATLAEYRRLDAAVRSMPLPAVQWDALAASISSAIDEAEEAREQATARLYRMPAWIRTAVMPLVLAASLAIVAGVSVEIYRFHHSPAVWQTAKLQSTENPNGAGPSSVLVDSSVDKANGPAVELVAIGPGPLAAGQSSTPYDADDATGSSSIAIASGVVPAHDTGSLSSYDME